MFEALDAYDKSVLADSSRLDIRLEYAGLLKKAGFWLRSAEQYRTILAGRTDHVDALIGYGELLNAEYQFAAAAERFARVLELGPSLHDRERALVGLGSARFGLEDFAAAADTFERLLKERPNVMSALGFLAIAKRKLGALDESLALWNKFLEAQPGASRPRLHRIEIEELKAEIERARRSVQTEPGSAAGWARLGQALRRQPDLPGAVEAVTAAVRLAPDSAEYRFLLGALQRDAGQFGAAAASFSPLKRDAGLGALALYNLAYCARRSGDRQLEAKAWAEAVAANRNDMYAYRRHVQALKAIEGLDLEAARATEAVRDAPEPPAREWVLALVRLAIVRAAQGDKDAARRAALEALRSDPNEVHAQKLLRGLLLLDEEAMARALVEIDPPAAPGASQTAPDPQGARARGALLLALGRRQEAESQLKTGLARTQGAAGDAPGLVALASFLRGRGMIEEALSHLKTARSLSPAYLYAHLDLCLTLLQVDRLDEAIEAAREAVRLDPTHPIAYSMLGSALRQRGDLEKAARALERAVALDPMDVLGAPRLLLAKLYGAMGKNEEARAALKGDLPEEPEEIYRIAWESVRDTYVDRTYRGQDWRLWERRFEGKLQTTAEALGAVALMLSSLDDRNTRLRSADQTANLLFTQRMDVAEFSASTGAAQSTSRTVVTKSFDDNVGYIAITNLDDPKLAGEVRKAVEQMKSRDGVILDLRGNQGGADSDVQRIAGMFVKGGTETGTVVAPEGTVKARAEPEDNTGKPLLSEEKPLVVLVDHNTASSAENLAGSLKEARRAVLVGEKTFGKSGIQLPRLLPGGAIVLVVGAEHADLKGSIYTGVGIKPDYPVEGTSPIGPPDEDPTVKKARDLLKRNKGGS